jgi:putative SOS response-associated peptidase YedK
MPKPRLVCGAFPFDSVAEVHKACTVVLEAKDFAAWFNEGGHTLLKPAANDVLQRWSLSRRVNSSRARGCGKIAGVFCFAQT